MNFLAPRSNRNEKQNEFKRKESDNIVINCIQDVRIKLAVNLNTIQSESKNTVVKPVTRRKNINF